VLALAALPLVGAPMAGGPTTTALVHAVQAAGGFAFLAGGYLTAEALAADIAVCPGAGVNLFVPSSDRIAEPAFRAYARELQGEGDAHGLDLAGAPLVHDDDGWPAKLDLLLSTPVPVVSFTFGLPSSAECGALQRAGSRVLATVTTVDEAVAAAAVRVDGLVVQGSAAGGHSGTFDPARPITAMPAVELTRLVIAATGLPVIAAGGVDGPAAVRDLIAAGAEAVAVGTLLLLTDESGASTTYREALMAAAPDRTVITRAFTGRPARGLRNGFIDRHEATAPLGYPEVHHLTRPLRRAAAASGDPERLHLWAGTGYASATPGPAADVVRSMTQLL
jgi:NAD(P)H-dependent flavin oxidoreductase YrpB (nitropropane dioxygenase family)